MPETPVESRYPGERLGLPRTGSTSVARVGRRLAALLIDWTCATILAVAFLRYDPWALPGEAGLSTFAPMLVFALVQILFIPLIGGSPGHRILGMRLVLVRGGWIGLWRPIVRTALLLLVIPAVVWDADQRGLHDQAAGSILIRV